MADVLHAAYTWPSSPLEVKPVVPETTAPSGSFVWVLAEPVPGYPPGTQVVLPRHSVMMSAGELSGSGRSALVTVGTTVARVCEVPIDSLFDWACERSGWLHRECHEWISAAMNSKQASASAASGAQKVTAKVPSPFKFSMIPRKKPPTSSPCPNEAERSSGHQSPPPKVSSDAHRDLAPRMKVARRRSGTDMAKASLKRSPKSRKISGFDEDPLEADEEILLPSITTEFVKAMAPIEGIDPAYPLRRDRTCEIVQELRAAEDDASPHSPTAASFMRAVSADVKKPYQPRPDFLHTVASPTTTLSRYAATVIAEVVHALQAERCSIFFVDEVRRELWCVGSLDMESFSMSLDQGIVGCVAREGELVNIADVRSHTAFNPTIQKLTGYEAKATLCVPIKHMADQKRTIGVVQVLNKLGTLGPAFSEQDKLDLLEISVLIADSFHRQRWKALESGAARGDKEALSLIAAHMRQDRQEPLSGSPSNDALRICGGLRTSEPSNPLEVAQWPHDTLRSLNFNALAHSPEELMQFVPLMMQQTGCVDSCAIPTETLRKWTRAARQQYRDNAFHSWFHAFSVFQMCYFQLYASNISSYLRFLDVFALLIAALCHDLDHPGYTNNYLIDSESELALRYNDVSVLENHHAALACELLRGESTRITAGLDAASQRALRRSVIRCILDTDMSHHASLCQRIVAFKSEEACEQDRELLLSACIHTSDLSAQTQPWPLASAWEERIAQEFASQANAERAAGREPAPFMQFGLDDLKQRGKLQRDFIDFVLVPLWGPYTDLMSELRQCYDNLVHNRGLYDHRSIHGQDPAESSG